MSDNEMTAAWVLVDLSNYSGTDISGSDSEDISESLLVKELFNEGVHSDETLSTDVSYSDMSPHDLMLIYERSRDSGNFNNELRTTIDSHEKNNPHDLYRLKQLKIG